MEDQSRSFCVGHHETTRNYPITGEVIEQARTFTYNVVTTPVTTPSFHSKVLSILSNYNSSIDLESGVESPLPLIPPFTPLDTFIAPKEYIAQSIVVISPWIDLASPDPVIAHLSRQVFKLELTYAAFCGASNVLMQGPRRNRSSRNEQAISQYARSVLEGLHMGPYMHLNIVMPLIDDQHEVDEPIGSLTTLENQHLSNGDGSSAGTEPQDLLRSWDTWNVIRTVCNYSGRLAVALSIPRHLPEISVQSTWFAEPLRILELHAKSFAKNAKGYPVLTKPVQAFLARCTSLRLAPWLLLTDVGPIPGLNNHDGVFPMSDGFLSPSKTEDTSRDSSKSPSPMPSEPTPAEASSMSQPKKKSKDPTPHLSYIRYLQRHQPPKSITEQFGGGYQDFLQSPLQPLSDNLDSITYEVFEKDPIKYDWYERAITLALMDWRTLDKPTSSPDGSIVIAVVGSGRGPLVTRALQAASTADLDVSVWAVEKNPNAYVLLQRHNIETWGNAVTVVKSDMRSWPGPIFADGSVGQVDILVSELLGSFGDNELSPECLDGVQHVLRPGSGISIPSSYTAHLTPVSTPRIHAELMGRAMADKDAWEVPYVVYLHQINYLSTEPQESDSQPSKTEPPAPNVQQAWEFKHPVSPAVLAQSQLRRGGSIAGGGGGGFTGGDGANDHNTRFATLRFPCQKRGVCHGLAGYFETVLYGGNGDEDEWGRPVELSINPVTMDKKSSEMISWFPMFFPLKEPLYIPNDSELEVSMWRQTDDRKVWYNWMVEAFAFIGDRKVRVGSSNLHSSWKNGCLM
ncbi:MAG: methyltransferase protein [Bogoriella megaspora]|nr:MAG: methyltransferase protein [Bogoriella megaspora]